MDNLGKYGNTQHIILELLFTLDYISNVYAVVATYGHDNFFLAFKFLQFQVILIIDAIFRPHPNEGFKSPSGGRLGPVPCIRL